VPPSSRACDLTGKGAGPRNRLWEFESPQAHRWARRPTAESPASRAGWWRFESPRAHSGSVAKWTMQQLLKPKIVGSNPTRPARVPLAQGKCFPKGTSLRERRFPKPQIPVQVGVGVPSAVVLVAGDLAFNQERGVRFLYGALRECGQIGKALDFRSREYGFEPRRSCSGPCSSTERAPACGAGLLCELVVPGLSPGGGTAGIAKLARQRASNP
jgi:hypothetical protein